MKIALICALILCLFIVVVGVAVWFTPLLWFEKFIVSFLCILTGIAFGMMGLDLWRDE